MQKNILNYRIIIEPEISENGSRVYVGFCPTLGISDYGDTVEDVLASIKDGIELAVEALAKGKKEVPVDDIERQIIASAMVKVPANFQATFAV
ncbi:type II toxin-antitoxin system HicB family antitoxin [Candidatus Gottesmanbacteria bacterium]|nr:type II toxin-antitoxin system HicB family antitoxin [Candidatus Gottesmanbacteria bacterium]